MTSTEIRDLVKSRTHHTDNTKVMLEVVSAANWAFQRVFKTAKGPKLISIYRGEITLGSDARQVDLSTISNIYAVEKLWVKLPSDATYILAHPASTTDPAFEVNDNTLAATITPGSHPFLYEIINVTTARFSPALPSGTVIGVDYYKRAGDPDTSLNNALDAGSDVPEATHQAIVDKATAQIFSLLDDDRVGYWEREAERKIREAIHALERRVNAPVRTKPFRPFGRKAL